MKLGIIGNGVVGSASASVFRRYGHEVLTYDTDPGRSSHHLQDVLEAGFIFVCLPTPQKKNSYELDTSVLSQFFEERQDGAFCHKPYVVRSTVPPLYLETISRSCKLPNVIHWPEFLTARTAEADAVRPMRNVVGFVESIDPMIRSLFLNLLGHLFTVRTFVGSTRVSALVKLMQNGFSAVKIAFFNEMRHLSDALETDWPLCVEAILAGGWVNPMHTQVPGPDGRFGFGGTCLPKDLAGLTAIMDDFDIQNGVCRAAYDRNLFLDRPRDV